MLLKGLRHPNLRRRLNSTPVSNVCEARSQRLPKASQSFCLSYIRGQIVPRNSPTSGSDLSQLERDWQANQSAFPPDLLNSPFQALLRDSRVRSISKARTTKLKREETGSYFRVPFTWPSSLLSAEPGTGHLLISYCILLPVIYKWDLGSIDIYFLCLDDELSMTQYYYGNLSPSRRRKTRKNEDILRTKQAIIHNLVPRALFPGFGGGAGKAREKRPGDEVA